MSWTWHSMASAPKDQPFFLGYLGTNRIIQAFWDGSRYRGALDNGRLRIGHDTVWTPITWPVVEQGEPPPVEEAVITAETSPAPITSESRSDGLRDLKRGNIKRPVPMPYRQRGTV